ncbi:2TM domain-containing protein [Candidatus Entotheonella palauensis]|uniref:2TM domain-containing protein n=1 Tax=Candidatus Entotheonella palauensis TaxID=93172 RepID=UPI0015C48D35|nr:2TM domain-containing protein [Candidatus Entotheonella palauensis]
MVDSNRRFTSDEVSAIVRRGLEHQSGSGDISYEELEDIALQSGISAQALQQAIAEETAHREREQEKEKWRNRRKQAFYHSLLAYLLVNAFLVTINLITTPDGYFWAIWPILGWGLGMAFHFVRTFFPSERELNRSIRRSLRRKKRHHARPHQHENDVSADTDTAWSS